MERITRNQLYTSIASIFAKRSTCRRLQVGCTIAKEGRVICSGYNGALKTHKSPGGMCNCNTNTPCTQAIHAEANAIAFAAREGISLRGSILYCTHSPCPKCAELIIQSGIGTVYYMEAFRDTAGIALLQENLVKVYKYAE